MIQLVPRVSRDTRTAKKAVSRLGGYAAPNFRFFAILMHARDRSIFGEHAERIEELTADLQLVGEARFFQFSVIRYT